MAMLNNQRVYDITIWTLTSSRIKNRPAEPLPRQPLRPRRAVLWAFIAATARTFLAARPQESSRLGSFLIEKNSRKSLELHSHSLKNGWFRVLYIWYGWFAMENPIKWNLETDKPWQTLGPDPVNPASSTAGLQGAISLRLFSCRRVRSCPKKRQDLLNTWKYFGDISNMYIYVLPSHG